jgi:hypothetical protein
LHAGKRFTRPIWLTVRSARSRCMFENEEQSRIGYWYFSSIRLRYLWKHLAMNLLNLVVQIFLGKATALQLIKHGKKNQVDLVGRRFPNRRLRCMHGDQ